MQQKSSANDRAMERATAYEKMVVDAFKKKDAAALAALCTRNAVQIGPNGKPITGHDALLATYTNTIKAWGNFTFKGEVKEAHAIGRDIWVAADSAVDGNGPSGPVKVRSHVLSVLGPSARSGRPW